MTPEQVKALWNAANQAGLTAEQINNLQPVNPYTQSGPTARMMQSAIARVAPAVAQQFLAEAGTTMSLKAQAAQMGLTERTPEIDAEIAAFTPRTAEQAKAERIEELIAMQPYGSQGRYEGDTYIPGASGHLTAALELEALAPERAAALKLQAQPPVPQPGALSAEAAARINAQLASANAAQGIY